MALHCLICDTLANDEEFLDGSHVVCPNCGHYMGEVSEFPENFIGFTKCDVCGEYVDKHGICEHDENGTKLYAFCKAHVGGL